MWLVMSILSVVASLGFGTAPPAPEERPYGLHVTAGYDEERAAPLVVLLHGYSSEGSAQSTYFGLAPVADREGFLLAYPNGTRDKTGNRFWNATDACCDFYGNGVDDVAYLDYVIDDVVSRYHVDARRIYLVGHSNGAFMSHRYACDRSARIAAIVTLAGMQWSDAGRCGAGSAVSVAHVHGRHDEVIRYGGGFTPKGPYPGAVQTVGTWAAKNGCAGGLEPTDRRLDLEAKVPGDETVIERHAGCAAGEVELWTIEGGSHVPAFTERWGEAVWGFFAAHPKAG